MNLGKFFQPVVKIVEVEKPRTFSALEGAELREALRALNAHPGFRYLVDRLRLQRAVLDGRLKQPISELTQVTWLQQGIFWTGWLEAEVSRLTEAPPPVQQTPYEAELEAFERINAQIERVG